MHSRATAKKVRKTGDFEMTRHPQNHQFKWRQMLREELRFHQISISKGRFWPILSSVKFCLIFETHFAWSSRTYCFFCLKLAAISALYGRCVINSFLQIFQFLAKLLKPQVSVPPFLLWCLWCVYIIQTHRAHTSDFNWYCSIWDTLADLMFYRHIVIAMQQKHRPSTTWLKDPLPKFLLGPVRPSALCPGDQAWGL